jgi:hypothetical protein
MTEEEYEEIIDRAYSYDDDDSSPTPWQRIRNGKDLFREDLKHLHKNNKIFQESDELVIEDESEEKLEPESSDVDEEVIE